MQNKTEKTEGDINLSPLRAEWYKNHLNDETKLLLDEDSKYFLHQSLSTPCINVLESVEGSYLIDKQGRKILDFHGNNVHQLGYNNRATLEAFQKQMESLSFSPRRYTNVASINLAKKLVELSKGHLQRVLFAPGGSEAISMALKLMRFVTGKHKTISWWDAFHGATLDSISVGGEALFRKNIGPLLPGVNHVPPPSTYRSPFGNKDNFIMESADYVDYIMEKEGDIGAFIAEPIRYTNATIPPKKYWQRIREICNKHNALLIFDEIPTAFGRTGYMYVHHYYDVYPDILVLGKGLGGGIFPMAAIVAKEELNKAGEISIGHFTHEKSPLGAVASLALINEIEINNILGNTIEKGEYFLNKLNKLKESNEIIGDVRGLGLLIGVEIVENRISKIPNNDAAEKIMYKCLSNGLSFKVSSGNVLTLMPPLTITYEELDNAYEILRNSFSSY